MKSIDLTQMPKTYTGDYHKAEVMDRRPWDESDKDCYLFLQFREGCGYDVYYMTPDEAEEIAHALLKAAEKTRKAFSPKYIMV